MAKSQTGIRAWKSFRDKMAEPMSAPDSVYAMLFRIIIDQRLTGPIIESRLCRSLDVPRSTLRNALLKLEREGFLTHGDNRKFVVRRVTLKEFRESAQLRETLESEAAALAAGRISRESIAIMREDLDRHWTSFASQEVFWRLDDALHDLAADHCRNPLLAEAIRAVRLTTRLFDCRRPDHNFPLRRAIPTFDEHADILDALERGSPTRARKAMQAHTQCASRFKDGG